MISILQSVLHVADPEQLETIVFEHFRELPFHFFRKDNKSRIVGSNNTMAKRLGFNKGAEVIGATDFDLCFSDYASIYIEADKKVILTETNNQSIEPCSDFQGNQFISFTYKEPMYSKNKKVLGVIGSAIWIDQMQILETINNLFFNFCNNSTNNCVEELGLQQLANNLLLTERQAECLFFLAKGMTIKKIGKMIKLSPKTVEHYIDNIKKKLKCNSRTELIYKTVEAKLNLSINSNFLMKIILEIFGRVH